MLKDPNLWGVVIDIAALWMTLVGWRTIFMISGDGDFHGLFTDVDICSCGKCFRISILLLVIY